MALRDRLVLDRSQADVDTRSAKGYYMAGDLQRVGEAVAEIADFAGLMIHPQMDWSPRVFPTEGRMKQYLADLWQLREQFTVCKDTPAPPQNMERFAFREANEIEKMLWDMDCIRELIPEAWRYCGEITCGEAF